MSAGAAFGEICAVNYMLIFRNGIFCAEIFRGIFSGGKISADFFAQISGKSSRVWVGGLFSHAALVYVARI